jgi:hypothetical protein
VFRGLLEVTSREGKFGTRGGNFRGGGKPTIGGRIGDLRGGSSEWVKRVGIPFEFTPVDHFPGSSMTTQGFLDEFAKERNGIGLKLHL